uniref:DOCKER domain-containing protein n=1 Tax=Ditylenchus dipsaci TaxID=166011 RepID=A0A915ET42_9BILA
MSGTFYSYYWQELVAKGLAKIDWSLLDMINDKIAVEENVSEDQMDSTQQAGYTVENFTEKIEKTLDTLILSERYEAVGPLCRLAIPTYEQRHDYKALVSLYAELQQANSRAAEVKASGKRHLGSYFRVDVEAVRNALGKDQVEILPPEKHAVDMSKLKANGSEPGKLSVNDTATEKAEEEDDPMFYKLHTNVKTFVYEERITDESVSSSAPEQAKLAVRRIVLTVEKSFPNTRRRQKVVEKAEFILNPLELACDSLLFKAAQIRRILNAAGILRGAYGFDKSALRRLDVKQLQLFLQGSVSPTVNAGVLAYAEAFTAPAQKERYGSAGTAKLVAAFKVDRTEYQSMLRNSFDGMLERLSVFFDGEKFIMEPFCKSVANNEDNPDGSSALNTNRTSSTAMHIFDSIGGSTPKMHTLFCTYWLYYVL